MTITAQEQHLHLLRHESFQFLSSRRDFIAAGVSVRSQNGQTTFSYKDTAILELPTGDIRSALDALSILNQAYHLRVMEAVAEVIGAQITVPEGHSLTHDFNERTVPAGLYSRLSPIKVQLTEHSKTERNQVYAEFQVYSHECRAHLILSHGSKSNYLDKPLLSRDEQPVATATIEQLGQALVDRYHLGLQRYKPAASAKVA